LEVCREVVPDFFMVSTLLGFLRQRVERTRVKKVQIDWAANKWEEGVEMDQSSD
jgi:hypothetical protein